MDRILSVLIVEDEESTCEELKACIEKDEGLKLAAATNNSYEALELVRMHLPNVIILDLELHYGGGNGILFLHELHKIDLALPPYILITTHNMSDVTLEQVRTFGADFTLTKYETNYSAQYVIDNINLMRHAVRQKNTSKGLEMPLSPADSDRKIMTHIQRKMDLIGISPRAVGYKYLVDAIFLTYKGETGNIAKILAPKYRKTDKSIERAMQNAIKQAWTTNDIEELLEHYTAHIRSDRGVPTLMEFISHCVMKIKQEME